jgi:hypothetical protein
MMLRRSRCETARGSRSGLLVVGAIALACYLWASGQPGDVVMFSGRNTRVADEFRGTEVTTVFGGYKLDLRDATFPRGETIINMNTFFGGSQVLVPEDSNVIIESRTIFGGFEDKTRHPAEGGADLVFRGTTAFGGVQIRN